MKIMMMMPVMKLQSRDTKFRGSEKLKGFTITCNLVKFAACFSDEKVFQLRSNHAIELNGHEMFVILIFFFIYFCLFCISV